MSPLRATLACWIRALDEGLSRPRSSRIAPRELARYGVSVNCIAPAALSRLTAPLMGGDEGISDERITSAIASIDEAAKERWTRRFHLRLYRRPLK